MWDYPQWMAVCELPSHNTEKCETTLSEGCCESGDHEAWLGLVLGEKTEHLFPCKVAAAGDERYLVCVRRVWLGPFPHLIGSSSVSCNEWLFTCAWFYAFVDFLVADGSVMAASRLLGVTAACTILLSFAAGWSGCIKAAIMICQQIFSILALVIFALKFLLKSCSKSCFFWLWRRVWFWSCNFWHRCA